MPSNVVIVQIGDADDIVVKTIRCGQNGEMLTNGGNETDGVATSVPIDQQTQTDESIADVVVKMIQSDSELIAAICNKYPDVAFQLLNQ